MSKETSRNTWGTRGRTDTTPVPSEQPLTPYMNKDDKLCIKIDGVERIIKLED